LRLEVLLVGGAAGVADEGRHADVRTDSPRQLRINTDELSETVFVLVAGDVGSSRGL
jgi:hypothetical protein